MRIEYNLIFFLLDFLDVTNSSQSLQTPSVDQLVVNTIQSYVATAAATLYSSPTVLSTSPSLSTLDTRPLLATKSPLLSTSANKLVETPRKAKVSMTCKKLPWPIEYVFPIDKLSAETRAAVDNKSDLRKPSQRYHRGLLIGALVRDVMENFTLYPDTEQKKIWLVP